MNKISRLLAVIALWRVKNVNQKKFIIYLSLFIGLFSGLAAVLLKNTIHTIRTWVISGSENSDHNFLLLLLPMAGILMTIIIVRYFVKDSLSHGVTKILFAISKKGGYIKPHNTFSNIIASAFTIALGGSVGAEAPITLSGASIGSNIGRMFRLNHRSLTLLIGCGAAGAIGGVFQAPIAGVLFTLEVLMLDLTTASIAPLLISSVTGTVVSYFLLGKDAEFSFHLTAPMNINNIPFYVILGVVGGLISLYFNWGVMGLEKMYGRLKNPYTKWIIGGSLLSLLIFIFPPFYGEGYVTIRALFEHDMNGLLTNSWFLRFKDDQWAIIGFLGLLMLLKVVATASTNGAGGVGGVFAPSLFLGGVTGYFVATVLNQFGFDLPVAHFALTGMAAVMAGVMHAPLTAIFLIAEITNGYALFIPLMITATLAYVTVKRFQTHNIYSKRLAEDGELLTHHKDHTVLTLMKLNKVIETDFHVINSRMKLGELVKIISQSRRNIFPVTNAQNQLEGIVLLDDIREIMFKQELYQNITVQKIMSLPPELIEVNENMERVMEKFELTGAWSLPVVDKNKYIGFVSKSKIFSVYRSVLIDYSDE